ncbi:MAG TPA: hypothetical protein VLX89_03750, partial [Actinomycetota bacterium]|nr:hypothetical protein [Actinomycetota bacterium]
MAKKGLRERTSADEEVVVEAIRHSIVSGQPVIVLTKDADLQEQFYKAIWLLDTHYRGALMARRFSEDRSGFEFLGPAPNVEGVGEYFES